MSLTITIRQEGNPSLTYHNFFANETDFNISFDERECSLHLKCSSYNYRGLTSKCCYMVLVFLHKYLYIYVKRPEAIGYWALQNAYLLLLY